MFAPVTNIARSAATTKEARNAICRVQGFGMREWGSRTWSGKTRGEDPRPISLK